MMVYAEIEGHDDWYPEEDQEEIIRHIIEDGGKDFRDKLATALDWFVSDIETEHYVKIADEDGHVMWEGKLWS